MTTRAKAGIVKPRLQPILLLTHIEPKSTKSTLSNPTWCATMQAKYDALIKNGTWTLSYLLSSRTPIGYKWDFRVRENHDGSFNKYKVRLMAKRFHQRLGYEYNETFFPGY